MMSGKIEYIQAYTEVNCLLKYFPKEYRDKLPNKLLAMIQEKSNEKYNIIIDVKNNLENQNISKKAKDILVVLKYKYWSNSSEKAYLMKKFYENEKAFQQEMSKRYNTDNLFQKTRLNEAIETSKNVSMIKYESSIFSKILGRLKGIFRR